MNYLKRGIGFFLSALFVLVLAFVIWVYASTYHPKAVENARITCTGAPPLNDNRSFRVLTLNAQFFAGKNYVFYFDLPNNKGPHLRPSATDLAATIKASATMLEEQDADFVLLQEIHDGAAATDFSDQAEQLLAELEKDKYPCRSETFYWLADFVPHPKIMGAVGMKLVTLSKYKIVNAERLRLPQPPMDWLTSQFYLKRAILDTEVQTSNGTISIINTHFDAFAQGSNTMARQVGALQKLLVEKDNQRLSWVVGGDLNLLLPQQRATLDHSQQYLYAEETDLKPLLNWSIFPSPKQVSGNVRKWATHWPNNPAIREPDRSIDFLLNSAQIKPSAQRVLNYGKYLYLSDHYPVISDYKINRE
ncbi:endonuclease/exonuclease/phosphatase family protein [Bacterioplanoides sp.]|uniref:endonuclease/exonuclease/phosphatase family protein n=1 Tax=Bacterioplanoides sp. TaxID=2066072 RepID=UPI003B5A7CA1